MEFVHVCLLVLSMTLILSCAMGMWRSEFVSDAPVSYVGKGEREPTVVFDAGLGNGLRSRAPV